MEIGIVRMGVAERRVAMAVGMGMPPAHRAVMRVIMMRVVGMDVIMLQRFVLVDMRMPLRQVQP